MKKVLVLIAFALAVCFLYSSCKTTERCDAYKHPGNYSNRY